MVPGPAALASPGNLLERQMLGLPRIRNLMNQKLWGWSPSNCVLMKPQSDSEYTKVWEPPLKCYLLEMCVSVSSAKRNLTSMQHWASDFSGFKKGILGLPWWRSGWESACQCRRHGFKPWSGKIPHAAEQLGPWATTTEPARLEPVLPTKRGRDSERPTHRDEEWPPLAATRESPRTETKTQHSQK